MTDANPVGTRAHRYALRLFVAGATYNSLRAIENVRRICDVHLADQVDLEIVDIYQQPDLAELHQIVAAPTLLKLRPPPMRRIIGNLSEERRVLHGLELPTVDPDEG